MTPETMTPEERMSLGYRLARRGLSDDEIMKKADVELTDVVMIRGVIAAEPYCASRAARFRAAGRGG